LAAELRGLAHWLTGGQFEIGARYRRDSGADGGSQVAWRGGVAHDTAKDVAGFLLHRAAVLGGAYTQPLLDVVIEVTDGDAGHGSAPGLQQAETVIDDCIVEGIAIETSSGNVFADLGLADAEKLKIKSGLVIEITSAVRRLGLTQEQAGLRMGIAQPKVSAMMRGDFVNLSERKLMECLNRLGYDIEIKVRPAADDLVVDKGYLTNDSQMGRPSATPGG
jgi:predicted XRE-type DNA-binding protein